MAPLPEFFSADPRDFASDETVRNWCSNLLETPSDSTEFAIILFLLLFVLMPAVAVIMICGGLDSGRREVIDELYNTPSYELHIKLHEMYLRHPLNKYEKYEEERELGDRFPVVKYEDNAATRKRTITIVEDLNVVEDSTVRGWVGQYSLEVKRTKRKGKAQDEEVLKLLSSFSDRVEGDKRPGERGAAAGSSVTESSKAGSPAAENSAAQTPGGNEKEDEEGDVLPPYSSQES